MVSGTRGLACRDLDEVNVLSAYTCRLGRNRGVWRSYDLAYGTAGGPFRICDLALAWVYHLCLCGLMKTSSCPHSDTRLSNPWDHLCPWPSSAFAVLRHDSRPTCALILRGC